MQPRSTHGQTRPASRPSGRSPTPARPMDDRIDAMRVGGFLMLALAAGEIVEAVVLSQWLHLDQNAGATGGVAAFEALLGAAMLQGSNAARIVVLILTGLGLVAALALLAVVFAVGFGHLWPLGATAAMVAGGVFLLNLSQEQSRGVVIGALALVLVGWVGSVAAAILLAGTADLGTVKAIRDWSSPQRTFEDAESGIAMKVPSQWVLLKEGNPIAGEGSPLLSLANTEVLLSAQVLHEVRTYSSADQLEFFLDGIGTARAAAETDFEAMGRSDTKIGEAPARRLKAAWKKEGEEVVGSITAWQDGPHFYTLSVTGPRVITKRLDAEVDAMERSLSFAAPWTAFLRDKAAPVREECPLLSEGVILGLARTIPRDSAAEVYCREGYRLAYAGQPHLDAAASERLRASMKTFFAALPRGKSERFGAWVERLRAGQATRPSEDKEMTQAIRAATEALTPEVREDLRAHFTMAVEMGLFAR